MCHVQGFVEHVDNPVFQDIQNSNPLVPETYRVTYSTGPLCVCWHWHLSNIIFSIIIPTLFFLFRLKAGNNLFAQTHKTKFQLESLLFLSNFEHFKSQKHRPSQLPIMGETGLWFSPLCYTSTDIWAVYQFCKRATSVTVLPSSQHDASVRWESMHSADLALCLSAAPDIPTPGIWLLYSPQLGSHSNSSPETPAARWVTEQVQIV